MRILLAEDESGIAQILRDDLKDASHEVTWARDGTEALHHIEESTFDVLITDIKMPGVDGLELLKITKERFPDTEVVVITGHASIESAVEAMKRGACDYVAKPFLNDEILLIIERIARLQALAAENFQLKEELGKLAGFENIVGRSPAMHKVFDLVKTVAKTDASVLIIGESGTGKERIARAIHVNSPRRQKAFVALSCAALPENLLEDELFGHERGAFTDARKDKRGRFELADSGTIFLDDIDDMSLPTQVKLLRVLQERAFERLGGERTIEIDIRVVAATKIPLEDAIRDGTFREDLYYRLNVVPIELPPLRDRDGDIPLLVAHFSQLYGRGREFEVKPEILDQMATYSWPGNVRELENAVERAIALAGNAKFLKKEHLLRLSNAHKAALHVPETQQETLKEVVQRCEREHIQRTLKLTGNHKAQAAGILGISRKNLWEKMKEYGLE
ncbi:MAG: sigma-54 dependent transcriptional regulator [Planctomycetota bacterium]